MSKPYQVGVTGGIGSGKSTVCELFKLFGVPVYNSDIRARELMETSAELKAGIREIFGRESITKDGLPDRGFIAKRAFYHPPLLQQLNKLVHPKVAEDYETWLGSQSKEHYVIREAALLVEAGHYKDLNHLIVVSAPESVRLKRVQKRDPQRSEEDILAIMKRQLPESETLNFADSVILNIETESVLDQVVKLHEELLKKFR